MMARDAFFANAEAEYRAGRPRWQPKAPCATCHAPVGTYSIVAGQPYCPRCAPEARKTLAVYGHLPQPERKP